MTLYAPRMPADPFARSVFIRSLYARSVLCQRHANAHTLGGTQGLGPRTPRKGEAPWRSGPMGAIGMIPKLFRMGCFSDIVKSDSRSRRLEASENVRFRPHFQSQAAQMIKSPWFGRHFETFLDQAAQVDKMDDLRARGPICV